ncbi:MAG: TonB-dependent receptor [Cellvibrionaceae bacterium]|nr:TonB-dependent receptor [Cellvibrionaceae bacterium]
MFNKNKLSAAIAFTMSLAGLSLEAAAQNDEQIVEEEVVVRGIRASLSQALLQKRNNTNVSEVIKAEDIGKFPDTNIAESLQRITGVAIERNGGEGQFITVRGFGPEFNTVLVNGRTMPTDNPGREFSFDVIASELVSGVELHKSPLANMQEGAIGGTVNITTRRPLDLDPFVAVASVKGVYDDLVDETSPSVSALVSATNDSETLGGLLSFSWSDRSSQRDELRVEGWINGPIYALDLSDVPGEDSVREIPNVYAPRNYFMARWAETRERLSLNGALQFKPQDNLLFTVDALYSDFRLQREGRVFQPFFPNDNFIDPVIDENGTVTSFSRAGSDTIATIDQQLIDDYNNGVSSLPINSLGQQMDGAYDYSDRPTVTSQLGINMDWQVNERFSLVGDLSVGSAKNEGGGKTQRLFPGIAAASSDPRFSYNAGDDIPSFTNSGPLQDESLYRGHWGRIEGDEVTDDILEAKLDAAWDFDGTLSRVRAGGSYTQREKDKRSLQTPSETFICFHCGYNVPIQALGADVYRPYEPSDFLSNFSGDKPAAWMTFEARDLLDFYASDAAVQWQVDNGFRTQAEADAYQANGGHAPGFIPGNSATVSEDVLGAWVDLKFAGEWQWAQWQALVGLRYVSTDVEAKGVGTEVLWVQSQTGDNTLIPNESITPGQSFTSDYANLLPSAVFDLSFNNDMKLKFAAATTVTRPTISSMYPARSFSHRENNPQITSGNPDLEPFVSTNFDLSWEWYVSDTSFVGVAAFYKDVDEWITLVTQPVDIPRYAIDQDTATDDPCCNLTYQETLPQNQESATASGFELALSHAWDNGFGAQFNYTWVDSDAQYSSAVGANAQGFALEGLSPKSFNLVGFYEADKWSLRLAYNWREEFLVRLSDWQGQPKQREDFGQWDMSADYTINEKVTVFFEGINLMDEELREFSVHSNRFLALQQNGRRFGIGIRATF